MSAAATETWEDINQRGLLAELARVRAALERPGAGPPTAESRPPIALDRLCAAFGLSPFERDVLLLCAGAELESSFAPLLAASAGTSGHAQPTFGLALAALPEPHWSALAPDAPLRHWRLVEVQPGAALTTSPLRIDERVLHYLTCVCTFDERLQNLLRPVDAPAVLPPSQLAVVRRLADRWSVSRANGPAFQLCGEADAGTHDVASWACAELGLRLHALRAADIPAAAAERELLARLWERETYLSNAALLIDSYDLEGHEAARAAVPFAERLRAALLVVGREPLRTSRRRFMRFDVPRPSAAEQGALWREALGPLTDPFNATVDDLAAQFNLGARAIHEVSAAIQTGEDCETVTALWDACRAQARARLDDLAQRIEPAAVWDDLVLPEPQLQTLHDIVTHVQQRARVYEAWGFAARCARGLGISALFAGPSGTGKTLAAEVLAGQLRLDLYRVDLSAVVSKYIGETEKNLRRVFDAAEAGGAVLLFDEADALFGKRSEVRDSHDRYANIEVSYLLQRMETYRGLAILTTNQKQALDGAFLRRLRFVVTFPFPDAAQRADIWRRMFPPETPTEGLDVATLARLNVAGGNIRNIALHAAFLAADAGEPVRMAHLLRAARCEYNKLERPLTDAEIGGWR